MVFSLPSSVRPTDSELTGADPHAEKYNSRDE